MGSFLKFFKLKKLARNFVCLEARSADVLALGESVDQSTNALDIWIPTAASTAI
jgi:hypothetical protein